MPRDKQLILRILQYIRDNATCTNGIRQPNFCPEYKAEQVRYHIWLCISAGFVEASETNPGLMDSVEVYALTWDGHEFLDKHKD